MLIKAKRILDGLAQKYLVDFSWESECTYLVYETDECWSFNAMVEFYYKTKLKMKKKEEEDVNVGCNSSFCLVI